MISLARTKTRIPLLLPLPHPKTLSASLPTLTSTVLVALVVSATAALPFLFCHPSWTARFDPYCAGFQIILASRFSLLTRFSTACKRASRPRLRSCPKKSTRPPTCPLPESPVALNFWDRLYFYIVSVGPTGNLLLCAFSPSCLHRRLLEIGSHQAPAWCLGEPILPL